MMVYMMFLIKNATNIPSKNKAIEKLGSTINRINLLQNNKFILKYHKIYIKI